MWLVGRCDENETNDQVQISCSVVGLAQVRATCSDKDFVWFVCAFPILMKKSIERAVFALTRCAKFSAKGEGPHLACKHHFPNTALSPVRASFIVAAARFGA